MSIDLSAFFQKNSKNFQIVQKHQRNKFPFPWNNNNKKIQGVDFYEKNGYISLTDFTLFLEDKTELINEVIRIDSLNLPDSMNDEQIKDYIKTIEEGILKEEVVNLKNKIASETNIAKKIMLLGKLASLKKKSW